MGETDVWLSRYHMIVDLSCSVYANLHPSIAMRLAKADIDIEVAGESQSPPISACHGVKACGCHVLTEDLPAYTTDKQTGVFRATMKHSQRSETNATQ